MTDRKTERKGQIPRRKTDRKGHECIERVNQKVIQKERTTAKGHKDGKKD